MCCTQLLYFIACTLLYTAPPPIACALLYSALPPIACALLHTASVSRSLCSLIGLAMKRPNTPSATVCPGKALSGTGTPQSQPLGALSFPSRDEVLFSSLPQSLCCCDVESSHQLLCLLLVERECEHLTEGYSGSQ